jgi:hypothetical protein
MTRRSALSLALALTSLVTFALVSISVRAGFFGLGGDGGGAQAYSAQAAQIENEGSPSNESGQDISNDSPEPRVTTEYVYYNDGTYGPAPEASLDTPGDETGSPSDADSHSSVPGGGRPDSAPSANRSDRQLPGLQEPSTPRPTLKPTASPHPEEHAPQLLPTPTPTPNVPPQELTEGPPANSPAPTKTAEPSETDEPRATEQPPETEDPHEPHETEGPHETEEPHETQEPHETPEPRETQEPNDD